MRFGISIALLWIALVGAPSDAFGDLRERVLRAAAIENGLMRPEELVPNIEPLKSQAGQRLFESKVLSLNGDMSCQTCHLERFSLTDGLPNAVGVGGVGEGAARLMSDGAIVPRNALPLWGRGAKGFARFFWDGKVEETPTGVLSQFGDLAPSSDALTVAVHLPFVEIKEMVVDDEFVSDEFEKEAVSAAKEVYAILAARVQADPELSSVVSEAFDVPKHEITFLHVAESIATFIRDRFRIRSTRLHRFAYEGESLDQEEIAGGLVFYGKGRCSVCHSGPHFSDFEFHAIPFPQIGFGKNGFGVDYGRYNVTFDNRDVYRFRTAPLFNVSVTGPYSHSGSVTELEEAVRYHFDPLKYFDPATHDIVDRVEYYKRLSAWSGSEMKVPILSDEEIFNIVKFLGTLTFELPDEELSQN